MAIYLGGETAPAKPNLDDLTPREIVAELDKYVVGQTAAKKAVAVALRNRIRRQRRLGSRHRRTDLSLKQRRQTLASTAISNRFKSKRRIFCQSIQRLGSRRRRHDHTHDRWRQQLVRDELESDAPFRKDLRDRQQDLGSRFRRYCTRQRRQGSHAGNSRKANFAKA